MSSAQNSPFVRSLPTTGQRLPRKSYSGPCMTKKNSIPEDRRFNKATPSGEFWMQVDNPAALEVLKLGQVFYIDMIPVPA